MTYLISDPSLTPIIADWVSRDTCNAGEVGFSGKHNTIGIINGDALIGGVVYHDWNPTYRTICMSITTNSPRWATRKVIAGLLHYPFVELGVQRITATVNENNKAALRLDEGIGFKREAVIERGAGDFGNIVILRLFVEEWQAGKFYKGHN